ncbi:hypothetical protein ACIBF5_02865 [Micromonospora sp. NPDC050417]|uniref:hypothetical protein n=1 Tax=Micromonospora sp. NPDC050417 TaxID=3364280 RepID=UPI0037A25F66
MAGSGLAGVVGSGWLARRALAFRGVPAFRGVADFFGAAGCRAGVVWVGAGACVGGAVVLTSDGVVAGGSGPVTGVSPSTGPGVVPDTGVD